MTETTFNMGSLLPGDLVKSKQGDLFEYVGRYPDVLRLAPFYLHSSLDYYPHLLRGSEVYSGDGYVTRTDTGHTYAEKRLDTDRDIVSFYRHGAGLRALSSYERGEKVVDSRGDVYIYVGSNGDNESSHYLTRVSTKQGITVKDSDKFIKGPLKTDLEHLHKLLSHSRYLGSKDWTQGDLSERVEWLMSFTESQRQELA